MTIPPRLYLSIVVMADDVETLHEWARVQAVIQRQDPDVIDVDARLVVDTAEGRPVCTLLEI